MSMIVHLFARIKAVLAVVGLLAVANLGHAWAQELSALARFEPAKSSIVLQGRDLAIRLAISQPVPWRVRMIDNPPRLVVDVREVDWTGAGEMALDHSAVLAIRAGVFRTGWSRLVLELSGPHAVRLSEMATFDDKALIRLDLSPVDAKTFAALSRQPDTADWAAPTATDLPQPQRRGSGPVIVVLDPGHGGIDPGAEKDSQTEAGLMLAFARELKELLLRNGNFSVVMTREEDEFVPLETRISMARDAGADVFISLHADALAEGEAQGATIYTLSNEASDAAAETLAERHDRDDLLAGVDLSDQDDVVAEVLMDMARTETDPRTDRLANALETAIKAAKLRMHRNPRQSAGFSVLKSPDIPSVLLELGFLSSARDLKRINDPEWRGQMAAAIVQALTAWSTQDATLRDARNP